MALEESKIANVAVAEKLFAVSLCAVSLFLIPSSVSAAGYEKNLMWGGRSAGIAGIATPYMQGSQALYFNPAGLISDSNGLQDVSLNLSPTQVQFQGPINNANDQVTSSHITTVPSALMYGKTVNANWGWGVGAYTSGGASADFNNVNFGTFNDAVEKTDLQVIEAALGVGWRVNDKLKVGAAWRVVMAQGEFATLTRLPNSAVVNTEISGLKDTQYNGFKLGAQYKIGEKTLLGLMYRSEINIQASGDLSGHAYVPTELSITPTSATAKTTFPMAATLGVEHDFSETWHGLAEYNWVQYSRVGEIVIDGTIAVPAAATTIQGARLRQDWMDEHALRLAGEYLGTAWPIRFGAIMTTQVTNSNWARAAFVPPSPDYTLTLGTGKTLSLSDKPLQLDGALEYVMGSGDVSSGAASGNTTNDIRNGTYKVTALALHLGATYAF